MFISRAQHANKQCSKLSDFDRGRIYEVNRYSNITLAYEVQISLKGEKISLKIKKWQVATLRARLTRASKSILWTRTSFRLLVLRFSIERVWLFSSELQ